MAMNDDNTPSAPFPLWTTVSIFVAVLVICIFLNFSSTINFWASKINPQTLEFYKAVLTVIVALIAAGIAASIQWRQAKTAHNQWRTAQQKLNFELFDRRFAIYNAVREFPAKFSEADDSRTAIFEYLEKIDSAEFLFNEQVSKYISVRYIRIVQNHRTSVRKIVAKNMDLNKSSEDDQELISIIRNYDKWIIEENMRRKDLFSPFLRLDQI